SAKSSDLDFTMNGRVYPRGSVIFSQASNDGDLGDTLGRLAQEIGAEIVALDTGWTDAGPNLGSGYFAPLKSPRVALAWGEGTFPTDAGATRYTLEQEFGVPVTPIRVSSMSRADLGLYDVVILPDGRTYGAAGPALVAYVEDGGVLIGFAGALDTLTSEDVGLISTSEESAWKDEDAEAPETEPETDGSGRIAGTRLTGLDDYHALTSPETDQPDSVPGVLLNTIANTDHWLSAGYEQAIALLTGSEIYAPLNEANGETVFRFAGPDDLLVGGYLWNENRAQLAYKPFVMVEEAGDGMTIAFTESPVTRAYLDGLNLLVLNAVLLGPAHTD
ncbi:MAG: carboxypeptidase, partial [Pseudomonadota bacterium]